MNDTEPASTQKRRHRRVCVQLEVFVKLGVNHIWRSRTKNISEGGVALFGSAGLNIAPGTAVSVNLKGILSDNSEAGHNGYSMRLVHASNQETGLQFL